MGSVYAKLPFMKRFWKNPILFWVSSQSCVEDHRTVIPIADHCGIPDITIWLNPRHYDRPQSYQSLTKDRLVYLATSSFFPRSWAIWRTPKSSNAYFGWLAAVIKSANVCSLQEFDFLPWSAFQCLMCPGQRKGHSHIVWQSNEFIDCSSLFTDAYLYTLTCRPSIFHSGGFTSASVTAAAYSSFRSIPSSAASLW